MALWATIGGRLNVDGQAALDWGSQLAAGRMPALDGPLSPTPHPLANLLGAALAPLGGAAGQVWIVACLTSLVVAAWLVFRLGEAWFSPAAGALAALILVTRPEILSFAARGYLDLPYLALVLAALLAFTRDREAALPVAAPLAVAGLLRPEAWLFAVAHAAWRWRRGLPWRPLVPLVAAPALLWLGMDLALTADPLHSMHVTQQNTEALGRATGAAGAATSIPGRIVALLGPFAAGILGLGVLAATWRRRPPAPALAALALSLGAATAVALAGMPVIMRYVLAPTALLALLGAGGLLSLLERDAR